MTKVFVLTSLPLQSTFNALVHTAQQEGFYQLAHLYGAPLGRAVFKKNAVDFCVEEQLNFTPSQQGEFMMLWVKKTGENTAFVANVLAKHYGVAPKEVAWAGRKDRHAVALQWFSLPWPIKKPLPELYQDANIQVLSMVRHFRKLRTGAVLQNHFTVTLHDIDVDHALVNERLLHIQKDGFLNYFGPQRFGTAGHNVSEFLQWMETPETLSVALRKQRKPMMLLVSAVRSALFNHVVSLRVQQLGVNGVQVNDWCMLSGSNSVFQVRDLNDCNAAVQRIQQHDCELTAVLLGENKKAIVAGKPPFSADCGVYSAFECQALQEYTPLYQLLCDLNVQESRRALRVCPVDLSWEWQSTTLVLRATLPKGVFMTALLKELFYLEQPERCYEFETAQDD